MTSDSSRLKKWLLATPFAAVTQHRELNPQDYCTGAVCAAFPRGVSATDLLTFVDLYTQGNSGAIVSNAGGQYLIIGPEKLEEARAHLRLDRQQKVELTGARR
jgi:predicted transcriptional regulator